MRIPRSDFFSEAIVSAKYEKTTARRKVEMKGSVQSKKARKLGLIRYRQAAGARVVADRDLVPMRSRNRARRIGKRFSARGGRTGEQLQRPHSGRSLTLSLALCERREAGEGVDAPRW